LIAFFCVYISGMLTFDWYHRLFVHRCVECGKHVLVEKSFTLNSGEASRTIEVMRSHSVFCMEAQMYRCHPLMARLKSLVADKHFGRLLSIRASFEAPIITLFNRAAGGAILDLGCYPISLMRLVAGEPISISGEADLVPPEKEGDSVFDRRSTACVELPDGVRGEIVACNDAPHRWSFTMEFEQGTIGVTDLWLADVQDALVLRRTGATGAAKEELITAPLPEDKNFYVLQIDTVNRHILLGDLEARAPAMDWEDSRGNMRALDMWRRAVGLVYPADAGFFDHNSGAL
jgi:predicted dehydrogenase